MRLPFTHPARRRGTVIARRSADEASAVHQPPPTRPFQSRSADESKSACTRAAQTDRRRLANAIAFVGGPPSQWTVLFFAWRLIGPHVRQGRVIVETPVSGSAGETRIKWVGMVGVHRVKTLRIATEWSNPMDDRKYDRMLGFVHGIGRHWAGPEGAEDAWRR